MVSSSRFNTFLILFPSSSITNSDILLNWKNTHFMVGVCVFFFTWFLIASFASSNLVLSFHSAIEYNNKHRTITIASASILDSFFLYLTLIRFNPRFYQIESLYLFMFSWSSFLVFKSVSLSCYFKFRELIRFIIFQPLFSSHSCVGFTGKFTIRKLLKRFFCDFKLLKNLFIKRLIFLLFHFL